MLPFVVHYSTTMLSVSKVRHVAQECGYTEIEVESKWGDKDDDDLTTLNSSSGMLAFYLGATYFASYVRINVYCATSTVVLCLSHKDWKNTDPGQHLHNNTTRRSLLVRRKVSVYDLPALFRNPQLYIQDNAAASTTASPTGTNMGYDSVQRWEYVGYTTGLIQSSKEMKEVAWICRNFDDLLWSFPPSTINYQKKDAEMPTKFDCGSQHALLQMLQEVMDPKAQTVRAVQMTTSGAVRSLPSTLSSFHIHSPTSAAFSACRSKLIAYRSVYKNDIQRIQRHLLSLSSHVRVELVQWLLSRLVFHAQFIIDLPGNGSPSSTDDFVWIRTPYSLVVDEAHVEYGSLVYPSLDHHQDDDHSFSSSPYAGLLCLHCGGLGAVTDHKFFKKEKQQSSSCCILMDACST